MSKAWQRGSTREWRTRRDRALRRDAYTCQRCGAVATEVHHINGKVNGDQLDGLVSLCHDCHRAITTAELSHRPNRRRPAERHPGLL